MSIAVAGGAEYLYKQGVFDISGYIGSKMKSCGFKDFTLTAESFAMLSAEYCYIGVDGVMADLAEKSAAVVTYKSSVGGKLFVYWFKPDVYESDIVPVLGENHCAGFL